MFPVIISTDFFVQSGAHFTLGLMQIPGVSQPNQNMASGPVTIQCNSKPQSIVLGAERLGARPKKQKKEVLKVPFQC